MFIKKVINTNPDPFYLIFKYPVFHSNVVPGCPCQTNDVHEAQPRIGEATVISLLLIKMDNSVLKINLPIAGFTNKSIQRLALVNRKF